MLSYVPKKDGTLAYPVLNWMDKRLARPYPGDIPEFQYLSTTTGYLTVRLTGQFCDTAANYEGVYVHLTKKLGIGVKIQRIMHLII